MSFENKNFFQVDMWSVGCILAEMYMNAPLFPGTDRNFYIILYSFYYYMSYF
jgi:hypothetical protein